MTVASSLSRVTGRIFRRDGDRYIFHGLLYFFDLGMDFLQQVMLGLGQLLDPLRHIVQF